MNPSDTLRIVQHYVMLGAILGAIGLVFFVATFIYQRFFQRRPPNPLSEADILRVGLEGDRVTAIRWYRELHAVTLPAAKAAVDAMLASRR